MTAFRWRCGVGLAVWGVAQCLAALAQTEGSEVERIVLSPEEGRLLGTMNCVARSPLYPDQAITLTIPESICDSEGFLLNFPETAVHWDGPDETGAVTSRFEKEGTVRYEARLTPGRDTIDIELQITNLTDRPWREVNAFNCINPLGGPLPQQTGTLRGAEAFHDRQLERTYVSVEGRPTLLGDAGRNPNPNRPGVSFYPVAQHPESRGTYFVGLFGATATRDADAPWMVTLSDPPGGYLATVASDALYLFNNTEYCCIHAAPRFGRIEPGETQTSVSRVYWAQGGLDDFVRRYEEERAESARLPLDAAGAATILLEPHTPANGTYGPLSFSIRAPWMEGELELRFPETLQSQGGLHFIDHVRDDMPPTSKLNPLEWSRNTETGALSYWAHTDDGVAFGGTATPTPDGVVLEFRVRNDTGRELAHVTNQMCLVMAASPEFGAPHDLSPEYASIAGRLTTLAETTPSPSDTGRTPWILLPTAEMAARYAGPREWPDGWWMVDQVADRNLIARVSLDREHLVAIAWDETASMLMTNTNIPCLHAGPSRAHTLQPGEEARWRGRIYLLPNDEETLLALHDRDRAAWDMGGGTDKEAPKAMRFEEMNPRDLDRILREAPVAYVPLGTLEFHGWHLPFGFDALKAHALCERLAQRTGGVVLPPTYHGFEGAHREYPGSIISEEDLVLRNLRITCDRLVAMGFRVLVLLTGHYPAEQMNAVGAMAAEVMERHPGVTAIGLAEPQSYPGEFRGDHAGKWETSIAMYLMPERVHMEELEAHDDPVHGINGEDPRIAASAELGRETVERTVDALAERVEAALRAHVEAPREAAAAGGRDHH